MSALGYDESSVARTKESICTKPDACTSEYRNQQTMLRIRDEKASLAFYQEVLGMQLLKQYDFDEWGFSLYFVGYADPASVPATGPARTARMLRALGAIELTRNHDGGAEHFTDGNGEPTTGGGDGGGDGKAACRGFGHIGLTVPDVYAACARFEALGVDFRKRPDEGGMQGLAFIRDPDGYSIEILASGRHEAQAEAAAKKQKEKEKEEEEEDGPNPAAGGVVVAAGDNGGGGGGGDDEDAVVKGRGYAMTQTMLRVRDPAASLAFYTHTLGMALLYDAHFPQWKFSLYFVGYVAPGTEVPPEGSPERRVWALEQPAAVELTHNWGTETDPTFAYANGNDEAKRGFGHIGLTVPDVYAACARFEALGVDFRKRPDEGGMQGLAFIRDPDGYSIEILNQMCLDPLEKYGD